MDYGTLAQLSNPGTSPLQSNPGIVDIEGLSNYRNLAQMRLDSLRAAQPLAQMDMERQQQAQKEYMMGNQGREDMVNLANMKAKNAPAEYTRDKLTADLDHAFKDQELRNKIADATENIGGDGDAYINGDESVKKAIIEKNRGKRMRNGYIIGDDPTQDDRVFTVAGAVRKYNPTLVSKENVAKIGAEAKIKGIELTTAAQTEIQKLKSQAAIDLQAARQANAQGKPLTAGQREALVVANNFKDDPEGEMRYWYSKAQLNGSVAIAAGKAATAQSVMSGGGVQVSPPALQEPPTPNPNPATPSPAVPGAPAPVTATPAKETAATTTTPQVKKKVPLPINQALDKLNAAKGTADEEKMVKFFVDLYGPTQLPQWVKQK